MFLPVPNLFGIKTLLLSYMFLPVLGFLSPRQSLELVNLLQTVLPRLYMFLNPYI
jgi:hypothetical protein